VTKICEMKASNETRYNTETSTSTLTSKKEYTLYNLNKTNGRMRSYCMVWIIFIAVVKAEHTFYSGSTSISDTTRDSAHVKRNIGPLNTVVCPEQKRNIIGDTFMKARIPVSNSTIRISVIENMFYSLNVGNAMSIRSWIRYIILHQILKKLIGWFVGCQWSNGRT
jgi:ribosomal protein L31